MRKAKLFQSGHGQAVQLPPEYRFEGSEVYVRRDARTGHVILLSRNPWLDLFELLDKLEIPKDFLSDRYDEPPPKAVDFGEPIPHSRTKDKRSRR